MQRHLMIWGITLTKATVTLAVRCLHSTQEPVMEILSLTTSTILAQDSRNWPICTERNQTLKTRWRHPHLRPRCHRSRGVSFIFLLIKKIRETIAFVFSATFTVTIWQKISLFFIYYTKKKTISSWSKISNHIRKIYFRLRFVEQQSICFWQARRLSMTSAEFGIFRKKKIFPPSTVPRPFFRNERRNPPCILLMTALFKMAEHCYLLLVTMKTKKNRQLLFCSQFFLLLLIYE